MYRFCFLAALLSSALFTLPGAAHANDCAGRSLTQQPNGYSSRPAINFEGDRIAFYSNGDTFGTNEDLNPEIILYDATTDTLIPITNSPFPSEFPSIDASGTKIAFHSLADFTGDNADHSLEIFLTDTTTMTTTQLTSSPAFSAFPAISADATRVAFISQGDFTGDNADGSREMFVIDLTTDVITQATYGPAGTETYLPRMSADGSTLAFLGENPDGDLAIFVYDVDTDTLSQATEPFVVSQGSTPSLSADGRFLTFQSRDDLTGQNPNGHNEIFLLDRTTDTLSQVTHLAATAWSPFISRDGSEITFVSDDRFFGGNPETNFEVFRLSVATGAIEQLTSTFSDTTQPPAVSGNDKVVAVSSHANLDGTNPERNLEIFTITCGLFTDSFESGDTSAWSTTESAP